MSIKSFLKKILVIAIKSKKLSAKDLMDMLLKLSENRPTLMSLLKKLSNFFNQALKPEEY